MSTLSPDGVFFAAALEAKLEQGIQFVKVVSYLKQGSK